MSTIIYRCQPQWGDASFDSLEELTDAIHAVCEMSGTYWDEDAQEDRPEYAFPEDGLREGRDYVIETEE